MKASRGLRALFILAGFMVAFGILGGGALLMGGYPRPEVTLPMWKFGQYALFLGVIHLLIYGGIYWQVRKLIKGNAQERD
ncbi:MAG: hypothetical protein R3242_01015 [Akkermansiaceae bacterium]|nr:hypothetical protein [Akkermansiaceae bacterium]